MGQSTRVAAGSRVWPSPNMCVYVCGWIDGWMDGWVHALYRFGIGWMTTTVIIIAILPHRRTGAAGVVPLVHLHDEVRAGDGQLPEEVQGELRVGCLRECGWVLKSRRRAHFINTHTTADVEHQKTQIKQGRRTRTWTPLSRAKASTNCCGVTTSPAMGTTSPVVVTGGLVKR